jgi:hypothetical protein
MNQPALPVCEFPVAGYGEATQFEKPLFDPRMVTTVRYADPAAWVIATAVAHAMAPLQSALADRKGIGMIVICESGPAESIANVGDAARQGFGSALRYPAANPGSVLGLSCIAFGFRGPTLCLLVAPDTGVPYGLFMAAQWLDRHAADSIVLAVCVRPTPATHIARAVILASPSAGLPAAAPALSQPAEWLRNTGLSPSPEKT